MKLVVPLSNADDYEVLLEAGADEFYCGYVSLFWLKKYGMNIPINRREYMNRANICDSASMRIIAKKMNDLGHPVKITFNEISYPEAVYTDIIRVIEELIDMGFNTFIVSDIGLLIRIRKSNLNCRIHLSGEALALNRESIAFFEQFQISRYIFPRKTPLNIIKDCIASNINSNCSYEAFVLNANCKYVGGVCNSIHCDEMKSLCFIPVETRFIQDKMFNSRLINQICFYRKKQNSFIEKMKETFKDNKYSFGKHGCGLCYIADLSDVGVTHIKIVGRGTCTEHISSDIKNLKKACEFSKLNKDHNNIKSEFYNNLCPKHFCYYPQDK